MTLVVTHANGFLGCFTREPDGTMRQRALIDTGEEPPTPETLATMGDALAEQWGWNGRAIPPAREAKALPPADRKTKANGRKPRPGNNYPGGRHPNDPPMAERQTMILAYLRQTPNQSVAEIVAGIGLEPDSGRLSRWHHVFKAMRDAGAIDRRPRNDHVWEYWALAT